MYISTSKQVLCTPFTGSNHFLRNLTYFPVTTKEKDDINMCKCIKNINKRGLLAWVLHLNSGWHLNAGCSCGILVIYFVRKHLMSCTQAHMYKKITKNFKIPNEQPAFRCQPDFGSHSQSLTNKLFSSFFFASLSCA